MTAIRVIADPCQAPRPKGWHQREPCRLPDADHLLGREWVAPADVEADTFSLSLPTITFQQTVQPFDALAPVDPAPGSLNGHYDYIGSYSHHRGNSPGGS